MTRPVLSVVVALQAETAGNGKACLEALEAQRDIDWDAFEVLLIDGTADGEGARLTADRTWARRVPARGKVGLPHLHGLGIAQARGDLIALTEACCTPAADWAHTAMTLRAQHEAPVVGGAVEPAPGLSAGETALFYCDYAAFVLPLARGAGRMPAGNNVVFDRAVLAAAVDVAQHGFWKTFFCDQLLAGGVRLSVAPELLVHCGRRLGLRKMFRRRWVHGRCFGAMRAEQSSAGACAVHALAGPAIPWLLTFRTLRALRSKPVHFRRALRVTPWVWLLHLFWSVGEWTGNLWGPGETCEHL